LKQFQPDAIVLIATSE